MTTMSNTQEDEAILLAGIEHWSRALENRDLDTMLSRCHPDITVFDVKPPAPFKGLRPFGRCGRSACRTSPRNSNPSAST